MIPPADVPNGRGGTNPVSNQDESDPSVGISRQHGVLYYGWENGQNPSDVQNGPTSQAMVAVSHDDGNTWTKPVDVSSPYGINNVQFPEVIAGDDDRAAFAFLGTPAIGDDQDNSFPTDPGWHLYISTTYDGGKTWTTVDTTPTAPIQRGCIDMQGLTVPPSDRPGSCSQRNMLDFNDITVDAQGRVLVAYTNGCSAKKCVGNPKAHADDDTEMVMRQEGGVFLYK